MRKDVLFMASLMMLIILTYLCLLFIIAHLIYLYLLIGRIDIVLFWQIAFSVVFHFGKKHLIKRLV